MSFGATQNWQQTCKIDSRASLKLFFRSHLHIGIFPCPIRVGRNNIFFCDFSDAHRACVHLCREACLHLLRPRVDVRDPEWSAVELQKTFLGMLCSWFLSPTTDLGAYWVSHFFATPAGGWPTDDPKKKFFVRLEINMGIPQCADDTKKNNFKDQLLFSLCLCGPF